MLFPVADQILPRACDTFESVIQIVGSAVGLV